jgi:ankyrin repeat protein
MPFFHVNKGRSKEEILVDIAREGNTAVLKTMLVKGIDVDIKDSLGMTGLMWAAFKGHENIAKILLNAGANLNAKDNDGMTPLMWAKDGNHIEIVKLLKKAGAKE